MSSTNRVTAEQSTKVQVAWSDGDKVQPSSDGKTGSSSQTQQKDHSASVSPSWPSTSCANCVTNDPIYLKSTPTTNTIVTTALVHVKDPSALKSSRKSAQDSDFARTDSDSDAQIDSMSSSDLEQCEELDNFELSPSPVAASSGAPDKLSPSSVAQLSSSPSVAPGDLPSSSAATGNEEGMTPNDTWISEELHVMSLRDFESLPPLWEDGGAGDFAGDDVEGSQWQMFGSGESVRVFHEQWDGLAADDAQVEESESFTEREEDIEQTLRDIYVSPFQDSHNSEGAPTNKATRAHSRPALRSSNPANNHATKQARFADVIPAPQQPEDAVDGGRVIIEDPDAADFAEADEACPRGQVEEYTSSLARVAEKAVSGYRSCDDVESYIGAKGAEDSEGLY
nr:hypothetical protein BaRGS_006603 [Batillaria attramentaria]